MDETTTNPSAVDKFVAGLTTLYRRFSVQFDAAATGFYMWLLAQSPAQQSEFLSHLWIPAWLLPPVIFAIKSAFTATPQPAVIRDTAIKAVVRAEAKSDAKADAAPSQGSRE